MLSIKNWNKFQHYHTGRGTPPWIKLYRDLLNDRHWFALEPEAAKFLISCWLVAAENNGELPDIETLAFRLRLASKKTLELINLCNHWINYDASDVLAECYQVASPDKDTDTDKDKEKDTEKEREKRESLRGRNTARGTRLPLDWQPDETDLAFGESEGVHVPNEIGKFRDYWVAQPGQKGVKVDWSATWRNWCRRAEKRAISRHDRLLDWVNSIEEKNDESEIIGTSGQYLGLSFSDPKRGR